MRDPGDGTIISATNISILTYAGDGQWCRQEDIYNPLRFVSATMKWCRKAEELGTLPDEAAAWMTQFGGAQVSAKLVIGANGYPRLATSPASSSTTAQDVRVMVRDGANTIGIDDLTVTRFVGDIWDNDMLREAMAGCRRRLLLRRRHPRLAARSRAAVPHQRRGHPQRARGRQEMPTCSRFVFTSSYVTVGRRRGRARHRGRHHRRPRADAVRPVPGAGREPGAAVRARARPARRRDVRVDHLRRRRLGPHPARRDHRRRGVRQAAVRDERHRAGGRRCRRRRPRADPGRRAAAASASDT